MKKLTLPIVAVLLMLTACGTLYTGVVTITSVVDSGMKEYAALQVAGKTTPALDAKVQNGHDKYRMAASAAQTALVAYKASGDNAQWIAALQAVRAAADEIIQLIVPLVTPEKATTLQNNLAKAKTI
jgi:hypothetical protein